MDEQGGSSKGKIVACAVIAGCLVIVVPIVGIIAFIVVPNLRSAMQRANQKRTMADMRAIAVAIEAYQVDKNGYPASDSLDALAKVLDPSYIVAMPRTDGWQHAFRYRPLGDPARPSSFLLESGGKDGIFQHERFEDYPPPHGTSYFDCDIVYASTGFLQVPLGTGTPVGELPQIEPPPTPSAEAPAAEEPLAPAFTEAPAPEAMPSPVASTETGMPVAGGVVPPMPEATPAPLPAIPPPAQKTIRTFFAAPPPPPPPGSRKPPATAARPAGEAPIVDLPFSQAKLVKQVPPVYPPIAKKAGVSGVVICEAIIGTEGSVTDVKVLRSVPLLDQAAIDAVKQWQFEPGMQEGQPVRMRLTVTMQFNIEGKRPGE